MKKMLLLCVVCLVSDAAFSQSFLNGVGIVSFLQGSPYSKTTYAGGITYSPRVNFVEMDNSSVSIGLPMSFAISASVNYNTDYGYSNSNSVSAMVNLPLVVNYNIGAGSTRQTDQRFGFFIGGGGAYHLSEHDYEDNDGYSVTEKVNGFGPMGDIGVRFGVGRRSKNVELRFSYMKVLDASKANVGGLAGLFNF